MAHWAKINEDGVVENVIVTSNDEQDDGESWIAENLEGTWLKTSYNTKKGKHLFGGNPFRMNFAQPGSLYISERDAFTTAKSDGEEDFILHEPTLSWVPAPIPEDATYAMPYGPEPVFIEQDVVSESGETEVAMVPQVSETDNAYVWMSGDYEGWWLNPNANYPKPDGEFYWNGFSKEWQAPTSEKPGENYLWNVFENDWIEIPELPESPTE